MFLHIQVIAKYAADYPFNMQTYANFFLVLCQTENEGHQQRHI